MEAIKKFFEIMQDVDAQSKNTWFEYCRVNSIPYIVVEKRRSLASVSWDFISYPSSLNGVFSENRGIEERLRRIYQKYAARSSSFSISSGNAFFENFPIDNAKKAAEEIYDLINNVVRGECH